MQSGSKREASFTSQGEKPQEKPTLLAPQSWTRNFQDCKKINSYCLNHMVCGILLWWPQLTNTMAKNVSLRNFECTKWPTLQSKESITWGLQFLNTLIIRPKSLCFILHQELPLLLSGFVHGLLVILYVMDSCY